jgi:hypothetical protein
MLSPNVQGGYSANGVQTCLKSRHSYGRVRSHHKCLGIYVLPNFTCDVGYVLLLRSPVNFAIALDVDPWRAQTWLSSAAATISLQLRPRPCPVNSSFSYWKYPLLKTVSFVKYKTLGGCVLARYCFHSFILQREGTIKGHIQERLIPAKPCH